MLFNSTDFFWFLAIVLVAYFALQTRRWFQAQNFVLLIASYWFYSEFAPEFCLLILSSTVVDFFIGRRIARTDNQKHRRRWLTLSLCFNLGVLAFFKYYNFFISNVGEFVGMFGMEMTWTFELAIVVGLSFYTFQTLSYTIDIYRGYLEPTEDFLDFALFVAFFPQLVAGPIERAANLLPQLSKPRAPTIEKFQGGLWLILIGLYKKIFVADQIALFVKPLFAISDHGYLSGDVAVGALLFGIQIYADFSGYSDIARGAARLLGIELMQNFRAPFFAANVQEYWTRWHISLSSWIKDYLYFPLALTPGINKRLGAGGISMVTMVVMGFWHGAKWSFVAWGAYMGLLLVLYAKIRPTLFKRAQFKSAVARGLFTTASIGFTFCLIIYGEVFFAAKSLTQALEMSKALVWDFGISQSSVTALTISLQAASLLLFLDFLEYRTNDHESAMRWPMPLRRAVQWTMAMSIFGALVCDVTDVGAKFQYMQF